MATHVNIGLGVCGVRALVLAWRGRGEGSVCGDGAAAILLLVLQVWVGGYRGPRGHVT
jgi:hypothetical protein